MVHELGSSCLMGDCEVCAKPSGSGQGTQTSRKLIRTHTDPYILSFYIRLRKRRIMHLWRPGVTDRISENSNFSWGKKLLKFFGIINQVCCRKFVGQRSCHANFCNVLVKRASTRLLPMTSSI